MVYKFEYGEVAISRVFDEFNVNTQDWVARSPYWIARALDTLPIVTVLEPREEFIKISNNVGTLPCSLKSLRAIIYDGATVDRKGYINPGDSSEPYYTINNNNTITFYISNCQVLVKYKGIPVRYNDKYQMEVPKIPDVEEAIDYVQWFIFEKILTRGYKHHLFSYKDVYSIIREKKQEAITALSAMDIDERELVGREISSIGMSEDYDIDIL